ncbi:hypothetical protein C6P41_002201 [Kluyveromyces marxianus]|nr:hypothetical protein C6P43_003554 [Kluyveromyces marxianus]KAG0684576.1 hypothetical protein C6P41_002201 [Kluyveromyces marxianus]
MRIFTASALKLLPLLAALLHRAQSVTITKYKTVVVTPASIVSTSTRSTTSTTVVYRTATGTYTEGITSNPQTTEPDFKTEILDLHNSLRAKHSAGPLQWDSNLASKAQDYANTYVCDGQLKHSTLPYGENLALGYNTTAATMAWYDEYKLYDFSNGQFSTQTGHFTQLVWKNSTKLGCAYLICGKYYGQYTICEYDPPGNIVGQFQQNVLPST